MICVNLVQTRHVDGQDSGSTPAANSSLPARWRIQFKTARSSGQLKRLFSFWKGISASISGAVVETLEESVDRISFLEKVKDAFVLPGFIFVF